MRAFPDLDGVAPVVDPAFVLADDDVVFDQRVFRPPDVEAEEVVFGAVVVDVGARCLAVGEDAGIHVELAVAGMAYGEVFDGAIRRLEVQHFAFAAAVEDGVAVLAAAQGDGDIDGVVALPDAGGEGDVVAGLGGVKRGLQVVAGVQGDFFWVWGWGGFADGFGWGRGLRGLVAWLGDGFGWGCGFAAWLGGDFGWGCRLRGFAA